MMHRLRHATGRLWITLLVGAASSLWLMSLLRPVIGVEGAPAAVAGWLLFLFFGVGWAADRLGLRQVRRLAHAADRAARDGRSIEAEALFRRALALLDSFLVSPAARRRSLAPLCARLARFYLARADGCGSSEAFIARYLAEHPDDREAAEQWVLAAESRGGVSEDQQDLLERLAAAHPRHEPLQLALARLYLLQEATDFPALQCYRRVCADAAASPAEVCRGAAALLRKTGHDEEWARQLALRWLGTEPADAVAGALPPPVRHRAPAPPGPDAADDDEAFRMSPALDEAEEEEADASAAPTGLGVQPALFWRRITLFAAAGGAGAANGLRKAAWRIAAVRAATWGRAAVGLGALVAAGGVWLWVSDADLFRESAEPPAAVSAEAGPAPLTTDRFTLQVAAYLKAEYAHTFVERLKRQGLDAYWTETASGGKSWYQVRIAHFPDRQAAREFGTRLKQKGVIEDFYVTHYSR